MRPAVGTASGLREWKKTTCYLRFKNYDLRITILIALGKKTVTKLLFFGEICMVLAIFVENKSFICMKKKRYVSLQCLKNSMS